MGVAYTARQINVAQLATERIVCVFNYTLPLKRNALNRKQYQNQSQQ